MAKPVSVVIPVAPNDDVWRDLLSTLQLPKSSEVLLACGNVNIDCEGITIPDGVRVRSVTGGIGRAAQMNAGAAEAAHDWLWFLHGDSRLMPSTLDGLERVTSSNKDALFFFDLRFLNDGPSALSWNEWAVRWRAGTIKIPFGDQGFLIKRELFFDLAGYREDVAYGEDHVLSWKVRQEGYAVLPAGEPLLTSGRKYEEQGWLNVTFTHIWLTLKQAFPEFCILLKRRFERLIK